MFEDFLKTEEQKQYYIELMKSLDYEYSINTVYPKKEDLFKAFNCKVVKVVILGQDPYHNINEANGLAFSVNEGVKYPPSLRNIFKELSTDVGCNIPQTGDLSKWVDEGVFLLNTILSVRKNEPLSHKEIGWITFTNNVIKYLSNQVTPIVFILWGANARSKKKFISDRHFIIESAHPSPLSSYRGFFGSKPFSIANEFLESTGNKPVDWCIKSVDLLSL